MLPKRDQSGTALVELAFAVPIFLFLLLGGLQLAVIVMQDYSVRYVARETARWVAIHPDTTDPNVLAHARAIAMPTMRAAGFTAVRCRPPRPRLQYRPPRRPLPPLSLC